MRRLLIWKLRARRLESRYESRPTRFLLGDFATIADTLTDADVVTPIASSVATLMPRRCSGESLANASDYSRFSYPAIVGNVGLDGARELWRRLRGAPSDFVHSPERMGRCWRAAGLVRIARQERSYGYSTSIARGNC